MDKWNEIKTAYQVARLGTVSAAAEVLGVHRATVLRHIDALEEDLNEKLFQRHSRGYIPTESGLDLMRVAKATEEQFHQFVNRSQGRSQELTGEFIVTSLDIMTSLLIPSLSLFQEQNPKITVRYLTSDKLFKLEYGEAHIAIRTGTKPDQPDNIVRPFFTHHLGLYAHADYVARKGIPKSVKEFSEHSFIKLDDADINNKSTFQVWMEQNVPEENIAFSCNNIRLIEEALLSGMGIAFLSENKAQLNPDIIEVFPPQEQWNADHWLVTHRDLHRSIKVQEFLKVLKNSQLI